MDYSPNFVTKYKAQHFVWTILQALWQSVGLNITYGLFSKFRECLGLIIAYRLFSKFSDNV